MFYLIDNYLQCIIIFILSFLLSCIFTKLLIYIQNKNKVYIYQREEVDKLHYNKEHTPSMGGISIFFFFFISLFLVNYNFIYDKKSFAVILTFFAFFMIGLIDDLLKVIYKNYKEAKQIVEYAADMMQISRRALDYSIWLYMSNKKRAVQFELFFE